MMPPRCIRNPIRQVALVGLLAQGCLGADVFLAPAALGKADGSSPADTRAAMNGGLQAAWDALRPGDTLVLVSGEYTNVTLRITDGGNPKAYKILQGRDTGGGLPVIRSDFDRKRPDKSGRIFVEAVGGASYWAVRDLRLFDVKLGVYVHGGAAKGILVQGLTLAGMREGVRVEGADEVAVRECRLTGFTKRGVRLIQAGPNTLVRLCEADAGGKAWATEPFQMGFAVESTSYPVPADTNAACVRFERCVARNSYHEKGVKGYWNADGFCVESEVSAVRYVSCRAFDCTDGGWDDKAKRSILEDCIALRNKRNFRFWGHAELRTCLSAFAVKRGGSGGPSGLWAKGEVVAERCTFYENGAFIEMEDGASVTLRGCLLSQSSEGGPVKKLPPSVVMEACAEGELGLKAPVKEWQGGDEAFDSSRYPEIGWKCR